MWGLLFVWPNSLKNRSETSSNHKRQRWILIHVFLPLTAASWALGAFWWTGRRRRRWPGRHHQVQPNQSPLHRLWLYLCSGLLGQWDCPCGHCLYNSQRGQSRPGLRFSAADGETGDLLRPAGLPLGQVHHCWLGPANSGGDVPVCAAAGVCLPRSVIPAQHCVHTTQENLRLHQPANEAAGRRSGRTWRWRQRGALMEMYETSVKKPGEGSWWCFWPFFSP